MLPIANNYVILPEHYVTVN